MEIFNSFRKIGKYEISNCCLETCPCQHYIKFENGETELLSSDIIYCLFKSEGLSDPHIDIDYEDIDIDSEGLSYRYAEFVRQRDCISPEEILKRTVDRVIIQQAYEKRAKDATEQQKIVDQYKASSRIDKLKNKNNIIK